MTSLRRVSIDELERALFTARVRARVAQRKWMMCGPDTPMGASALFKLRLALEREITTAKAYSDALQNIWVQEPARLIVLENEEEEEVTLEENGECAYRLDDE